MSKKSEPDLFWAIDRETGEAGQFTEGRLSAWPRGYTRLREAPSKSKPSASAAVSVPKGTDMKESE